MADDTAIRAAAQHYIAPSVGATLPRMSEKLEDPQWRSERARKASASRTTAEYHIRKLIEMGDSLTPAQLDSLAELADPSGVALLTARVNDLGSRLTQSEAWIVTLAKRLGMWNV